MFYPPIPNYFGLIIFCTLIYAFVVSVICMICDPLLRQNGIEPDKKLVLSIVGGVWFFYILSVTIDKYLSDILNEYEK